MHGSSEFVPLSTTEVGRDDMCAVATPGSFRSRRSGGRVHPGTRWLIVHQAAPVQRPGRVPPRHAREAGACGRKRRQKQGFRGLIGLEDRRQAGMVLLYRACLF